MEQLTIHSLDEIGEAAKEILHMIGGNRVICFYGGMGAGKTTLIKAICKELGVKDKVVSPTFAIINEYCDGKSNPIYHFDFYRINKIEEVYDFGYEEYFYKSEGICLIEWPELIEDILPSHDVCRISITVDAKGIRTVKKQ